MIQNHLTQLGEEILCALDLMARCTKQAGLFRASEALDDAKILVCGELAADTQQIRHCGTNKQGTPVTTMSPP